MNKWTDYETELYEEICVRCHREKECHDNATTCERYDKMLAELKAEKLKCCPFCGSDEVIIDELTQYIAKNEIVALPQTHYFVSCLNCGASGRDEVKKGRAVKAWNQRYEDGLTFCFDCRWFEGGICKLHKIKVRTNDYCSGAWRR